MYIESADNIITINDNLAPPTKQCSQLIWDIFSHWVLWDEVTSLGLQLLTLSVVVLWGPILVLDSSVVYVCTLWCCVRWDHQTLYTDCVHNLYITILIFKTLQRASQLNLLETQIDEENFEGMSSMTHLFCRQFKAVSLYSIICSELAPK